MSEQPPELDLGAAHLRPARREEPRAAAGTASEEADRLPWEDQRGLGTADFAVSWWRLVRAPVAAWEAVPRSGGARRAWTFALLCGAVFGVASELVDSSTVALLRYGRGEDLTPLFQLDIAGRSLEWLPISMLSAAGCLVVLLVVAPLFVLLYGLLVLVWTTVVHGMLALLGGLAASRAGYQGTLRAVCYSQAAMAAAIAPWIGDPAAGVWSFCLQVPGLARMHGCGRTRAAVAVGVPAGLLVLALVLLAVFGDPQTVTGPPPAAG